MNKLTVLAYGGDADAIVRRLMDLKCVQIQKSVPDGDEFLTEFSENGGQRLLSEEKLACIREILPSVSKYSRRRGGLGRRIIRTNRERFVKDGRAERAWEAAEHVRRILADMQRINEERTQCEALLSSLVPWLEYDAPLNETGSRKTAIQLGSCAGSMYPDTELANNGAFVEPVFEDKSGRYLAITYHRDDADAVERTLVNYGFVKIDFSGISSTAQSAYTMTEARIARLQEEYLNAEDSLAGYADLLDDLEVLCDIEETTVEVCRQKQKLLQTRNCVILEGWIPEKMAENVKKTLSSFECACEIATPEEGDEPPVLLKNDPISSNFEWVIGMYSYPKYGSFDPTLIMSIFYFLIFGMMFADVGYGLVMVLACFIGVKLLNPKPGMQRMLLMFGYCGFSCMIMGVLFGGWFGDMPVAIINSFFPAFAETETGAALCDFFYNGVIFNPVEEATGFLVISLAMGEIHLIAGMAVNMYKTWKEGKTLVAICSTVPFWVLFIGLDLLAPSLLGDMLFGGVPEHLQPLFAQFSNVGTYVTIAGFALILLVTGIGQKSFVGWLVKGLGGLYSLISFASDLMSYSRILALGLVANVIASVINKLTGLGATGVVGFIFMVLIMIVGHLLNLAINLLGTFVHAARLQYIEFFGKFYEDGGEPFSPALPAENYSEDCQDVTN